MGFERSSCSKGSGVFSSATGAATFDTGAVLILCDDDEPYVSTPLSTKLGPARVDEEAVLTGAGLATISVECEPDVHPGNVKNSSKEITLFLQHA
jgi:hypothetical protein